MTQVPQHAPGGARGRAEAPEPTTPDPSEQPDTTPPDWLAPAALPVWAAAVELLTSVRIVNKSDLTALARYCQFLSEWVAMTRKINEDGHVVLNRFEQSVAHPLISQRDAVERSIRNLEKALGLDPSSYMDMTRDIHRSLTDKNKARGGGRRVGGFLNKKDGAK